MEIVNNGEIAVKLPESLADLLIEGKGWKKGAGRLSVPGSEDDPIPMTHIPGVVPGISMNRLKKLVADGTIPFTPRDRMKLVKPSDVRAVVEAGL